MPLAPSGPQYFRMHGQMDTESEADAADVHMEVSHWPALSEASASNGQEGPVNLEERVAEQLR